MTSQVGRRRMVFCMIAAMTFLSSRARAQPIADPCAGTLPQGSFLQPPACPEFPAPCNPLFGDTISSCDHRFFMTMQGDGNLVLYQQNGPGNRSEEHTSELQSQFQLVCRLLLDK